MEAAKREAKNIDLETEAFTASLPSEVLALLKERWGENLSQQVSRIKSSPVILILILPVLLPVPGHQDQMGPGSRC